MKTDNKNQEQEPVNVCCVKCGCWLWVGFCKKIRGGYICEDCIEP